VWSAVLVVACGPAQSEQTTVSSTVTTPASTAVPKDIPTTATQSADDDEVESYLVAMSNLSADVNSQLGDFECSYNEQFSPGFCSGEIEEGEESEPPPVPTEEEQVQYQRGYWLGMFQIHLAHADTLDAVEPPRGFETAHQEYVNSYRAYFVHLNDRVGAFSDLDEFTEFLNVIFDPLAGLPPELERQFHAFAESCRSLADLGSDPGFRADLGCPTPPEEPVPVAVDIGDQWSATPDPLPVGDGLVAMSITNNGSETVQPVVIEIWDGDPLNLPIVDGFVDISRGGVEFDVTSDATTFGISYAGENWEVNGEPLELPPGASVEASVWSEGTLVVFDYRQGEFEAGAYVVIEPS
jgi:hypothetical protein